MSGSPVSDYINIIPSYVKNLPFEVKVGWMERFNLANEMYGALRAVRIANLWAVEKMEELKNTPDSEKEDDLSDTLKAQILEHNDKEPAPESISEVGSELTNGFLTEKEKVEEHTQEIIGQSFEAKLHSFKLNPNKEQLISYSEQGEIVIEAVLADDQLSTDGKLFTSEALISMANKINKQGIALPDIEHKIYNKLLSESNSIEDFKSKLKQEKGIFKKIKAFFVNGKLLIKAWLDKRYSKVTQDYKSLSIEAAGTCTDENPNTYIDAEPLSFTFTNTPKLMNANILNVA